WNCTHVMIRHALLLRKAIDRWVIDYEELRPLLLSPEDWKLLEQIADLLKVRSLLNLRGPVTYESR
ncbi:hypothetical protein JAAARDRAFT_117508, partial [Jaapia argillacea MUCL 33604]